MSDTTRHRTFRLAPMDASIRMVTLVLLALPPAFIVAALVGPTPLVIPALFISAVYAWIWLWFRPSRFVVQRRGIEVYWPLRRRLLPRDDIASARCVSPQQLKQEIGLSMRIGAGGLWGGFGWLWTRRRGVVRIYISRTDGYVWIEHVGRRPWLITPENPHAFVHALSR
jgi:hypothetical protein